MLAIRLSRTGKKHQAHFRIVVSDSHRTPKAKFVEILGNYDPHAKKLNIEKDRLEYYLKNGAQPSNTVAKLLKNEKIALPKWVKIAEKNRAPKKTEEPKEQPKAEEAPVEEKPADEGADVEAAPTEDSNKDEKAAGEAKTEEVSEPKEIEKTEEVAEKDEAKSGEEAPAKKEEEAK